MGALTLKSFPFEVRGWDIESFASFDPTDSCGSKANVFITHNQVIQVEPDFDPYTLNQWLSDKGRQFFDGLFVGGFEWQPNAKLHFNDKTWDRMLMVFLTNLYAFSFLNVVSPRSTANFLLIVFQNLSIEFLSALIHIAHKNSYIKVKNIESSLSDRDFESNFQHNLYPSFNTANSEFEALVDPHLCVLISTNPRLECYYANIVLRQKFLKNELKCLVFGSLLDLTFPVAYIGSTLNSLESVLAGKDFLSLLFLWSSHYPFFIINDEFLKRQDGKKVFKMLEAIKYSRSCMFLWTDGLWNKVNLINPAIHSVGVNALGSFEMLSKNDMQNLSSLYFINTSTNNLSEFKRITELRLLYPNLKSLKLKRNHEKRLFLDQNHNPPEAYFRLHQQSYELPFFNITLPTNHFYEREETFFNFEGFVKKSSKLINHSYLKSDWQGFRKISRALSSTRSFNRKDFKIFMFNGNLTSHRSFTFFHFLATQKLTYMGFLLESENHPFIFDNRNFNGIFKKVSLKIRNTKTKYWLDDFFNGGRDGISHYSSVLSESSDIARLNATNFF